MVPCIYCLSVSKWGENYGILYAKRTSISKKTRNNKKPKKQNVFFCYTAFDDYNLKNSCLSYRNTEATLCKYVPFLTQISSVTLRIMKGFIYTTHGRTGQRGDTQMWSSTQNLYGLQMTMTWLQHFILQCSAAPWSMWYWATRKNPRQHFYMIATDYCRKSNSGTVDSADISTFISILCILQNTVLLVLTEDQIFSPILCFKDYTKSSEKKTKFT